MSPTPREALRAMFEKWQRMHDDYSASSREANRAGNIELDAYRDGKAMGIRDCLHDLWLLLASDASPQPHEVEHDRDCPAYNPACECAAYVRADASQSHEKCRACGERYALDGHIEPLYCWECCEEMAAEAGITLPAQPKR